MFILQSLFNIFLRLSKILKISMLNIFIKLSNNGAITFYNNKHWFAVPYRIYINFKFTRLTFWKPVLRCFNISFKLAFVYISLYKKIECDIHIFLLVKNETLTSDIPMFFHNKFTSHKTFYYMLYKQIFLII